MALLKISAILLVIVVAWTTGTDDVNPLEPIVQQLTARVQQLEAKLSVLETQMQKIQPSVTFSVQHSGYAFNFTGDSTLIFDQVLLNSGGGYSTRHGEFTTPTSGLYFIGFRGWGKQLHEGFLQLRLNGNVTSAVPIGDGDYENASGQSMLLQLNQGDVLDIFVVSRDQSNSLELLGMHHTTFMGFLLHAD